MIFDPTTRERAQEENSKNREINAGGGKKSKKFQFCEPIHSFYENIEYHTNG